MFPCEALGAGCVGIENPVRSCVMNLPLLRSLVETDVGGAGDLERPKRQEVDSLGVKALHQSAAGLETEGGFHDPPMRC